MMTHDEYRQQLPDYVLNLLSPQQLGSLEHHIAQCASCRQALQREKSISRLVQSTLHVVSKPDPKRLREFMLVLPQKRSARWNRQGWQKQLAPVMLVLFLAAGILLTQITMPSGTLPAFVTTAHAATATSTNTPTATAAQTLSAEHAVPQPGSSIPVPHQQTMPILSNSPQTPVTTPEPLPTPAAAAIGRANQ